VWQSGELQRLPMRATWASIAMSDSSAFHITLAHASILLAQEHNQLNIETTELMQHYTATLHAVSKRLQDPVDSISDGVIGTILGFACLDVRSSDIDAIWLKLTEIADCCW